MYHLKRFDLPIKPLAKLFLKLSILKITLLMFSGCSFVTFGALEAFMQKDITAFNLSSADNTLLVTDVCGQISGDNIILNVPAGIVVTSLVPQIVFEGADISPASGVVQDFTTPVAYTVKARDGSAKTYTVSIKEVVNNNITGFRFVAATNNAFTGADVEGLIDNNTNTISLTVPYGTALTALIPEITIDGVSVSPASNQAQDFSAAGGVLYTVTASNGATKQYTVKVVQGLSSANSITDFKLEAAVNGTDLSADVIGTIATTNTIELIVPSGTNVTALKPTIAHSGASISPDPTLPIDLSTTVNYTVTAADGTPKVYSVVATSFGEPQIVNRNLTSSAITETSAVINWQAATDETPGNSTVQDALLYKLVYSETPISTITEANAATVAMDFFAGVLTYNVTGLRCGTPYYFNVIVKDAHGNQVIYNQLNASTLTSVTNGLEGQFSFSGNFNGQVGGFNLTTEGTVNMVANRAATPNSACRITTNNSLYIADTSAFSYTNEISVAVWVNLTDVTTKQVIISKMNTSRTMGYEMGIENGVFYAEVRDSTSNPTFNFADTTSVAANNWVHLAFTWRTGGRIRTYVNGVLIKDYIASGSPIGGTPTDPFRIGADKAAPAAAPLIDGCIDDVRVYGRELASAEILELYNMAAD